MSAENVLVVVENDKSGEILAKRAEDLYSAKVIKEPSLKDLMFLNSKNPWKYNFIVP